MENLDCLWRRIRKREITTLHKFDKPIDILKSCLEPCSKLYTCYVRTRKLIYKVNSDSSEFGSKLEDLFILRNRRRNHCNQYVLYKTDWFRMGKANNQFKFTIGLYGKNVTFRYEYFVLLRMIRSSLIFLWRKEIWC